MDKNSIWVKTLFAVFLTTCIALFFIVWGFAGFFGLFLGFVPGMAIWGFLILLAAGLIVIAVLIIKQ